MEAEAITDAESWRFDILRSYPFIILGKIVVVGEGWRYRE